MKLLAIGRVFDLEKRWISGSGSIRTNFVETILYYESAHVGTA